MCSDLDLFECPRHPGGLRLTPAACATMWRRGKRCADMSDPLWPCSGCPIGAQHAGEAPDRGIGAIDSVCSRCLRPAGKFVRGVCVSCYNREREVRVGRDRRGHRPQFAAPTPLAVQVLTRSQTRLQTRAALSVVEVMVHSAKGSREPLAFARAPAAAWECSHA